MVKTTNLFLQSINPSQALIEVCIIISATYSEFCDTHICYEAEIKYSDKMTMKTLLVFSLCIICVECKLEVEFAGASGP